jgi:hypothetical protein
VKTISRPSAEKLGSANDGRGAGSSASSNGFAKATVRKAAARANEFAIIEFEGLGQQER